MPIGTQVKRDGLAITVERRGTLFAPFWCLCQKLSLSLLYFNKTLLHKSSDWSTRVSGPRLNSSHPEAKNPKSFLVQQQHFNIKKKWQEYTELYKKDLHNSDNHNGVITHQGPDILECEVKWALRNITANKASGGDGIPVELFQILKDDAVKGLHSICQQIWKFSSGHRTGKGQFSFQSQRKAMPKKCSNYCTIVLISHTSKVMLKILQARLQQYLNRELPDIQAGSRKGRRTTE